MNYRRTINSLILLLHSTNRQLMTLLGKSETNDGWKMIRQILEALVYIHKRKIIHRDLKPGKFEIICVMMGVTLT
jgi:serine/threonine protein kinase